jgi:hypothetical protein
MMHTWLADEEDPVLLVSREWQDFVATCEGDTVDANMFPPSSHSSRPARRQESPPAWQGWWGGREGGWMTAERPSKPRVVRIWGGRWL